MGNALNLNSFSAMGLQAQDYALTHILVWNMLVQLIVVGCLYMLARLAAGPVRPWLRRLLARHPLVEHALPHLTRVVTTRLVSPIITVVLLWFAHENRSSLSLAQSRHPHLPEPVSGLGGHSPADLPDEKPYSGPGNLRDHLVRGRLEYRSPVHPFLALLDSIDLTISNVHLTLLSMIEGGFLLVALFWLAKKISVFFEHWIKTVEHITPSVQVLLYKLVYRRPLYPGGHGGHVLPGVQPHGLGGFQRRHRPGPRFRAEDLLQPDQRSHHPGR